MFLNHPPHLQPFLTRHTFKRFPMVSRQRFSSILVRVCRPHKHLTLPTNGSSVTVHAEFIFERNVGLLHKMFHECLGVNFGVCSPPWPSMPFCQQVHFTHSHNISKWHPGSRGGTGTTKRKWFVTLKSSFTIYEKEDVRLSLKHQLYKCMYSWL